GLLNAENNDREKRGHCRVSKFVTLQRSREGSAGARQQQKNGAEDLGEISPNRSSNIELLNLQASRIQATRMLQNQTAIHPLPFIRVEGRGEGLLFVVRVHGNGCSLACEFTCTGRISFTRSN